MKQGLKGPPSRSDGPQVQLHIWIDKIKEPDRIIIRVEDNREREKHETANDVHRYLELARQVFAVEKFTVMEDGSFSAKVDL